MNMLRSVACAVVFGVSLCGFAAEKIPADQALPKDYSKIPVADILYCQPKDVDRPPLPTKSVRPVFPMRERLSGTEGRVTLAIVVDVDGRIVSIVPMAPTNDAFAQSAVDCIKQWKFRPAKKGGKPVRCITSQLIEFVTK